MCRCSPLACVFYCVKLGLCFVSNSVTVFSPFDLKRCRDFCHNSNKENKKNGRELYLPNVKLDIKLEEKKNGYLIVGTVQYKTNAQFQVLLPSRNAIKDVACNITIYEGERGCSYVCFAGVTLSYPRAQITFHGYFRPL